MVALAFLTIAIAFLVACLTIPITPFSDIGGAALAATAFLAAISGARAWVRSNVALEDRALRVRSGMVSTTVAWTDVDAVRVEGAYLVVQAGDRRLVVDPARFACPADVLEWIRRRVPLDAWSVDARAAEEIAYGERSARYALSSGPVASEEVVGYRDSAGSSGPVDVASLFPPARLDRRRDVRVSDVLLAVGGLLAAMAGALLVAQRERGAELFLVGGVVGMGYAGHRVYTRVVDLTARQLDRARRNAAFVGHQVRVASGTWTSLDGTRRRRHHPADLLDPWEGSHQHYERLDPDTGETLESFSGTSAGVYEGAAVARVREVGVLSRPIDSGRHYGGFPRELDQWAPHPAVGRGAARVLVVDTHSGAVFVHRFAEDRIPVGDTMHADRAAAMRQIASEYPGEAITWQPSNPSAARWHFWSEVDAALGAHDGAADHGGTTR